MNLSRFATEHLKAILFVTVVLCGIGAWALTSFPVSILPEVTFPRVKVIADAGERPARNIEVTITRPIEEAVATVPDVTRVHSTTSRGTTEVAIDFRWGTDIFTTQQLVNTKINELRSTLPADTQVSVERMDPTVFPIMGLSIKAKGLPQAELWNVATYQMKPLLTRVPGVARVVVQGGRVPEIAVEVNPVRLAAFKLALTDVEQALTQANVIRGVGLVNRQFQTYSALVSSETTDADSLKQVVVAQRSGIPITLSQIADVHPAVQDNQVIVTAKGGEAVLINIVRQPDANTVSVTEAVLEQIKALHRSLPHNIEIGVFYNQADLVREAIGSVRDAVLIGAVLAIIVLMLFLGNVRATLVTAIIIPATVLITFLLMRLAGLTLNLMTLGALAVGIGLVIDDAIVVVENIFRHLAKGVSQSEAIRQAASEIAAPMISSTLTTVVVFLPLVLLSGVAGAFFLALAVTLVIALMVSLALALLVSPSLCAAFLRVRPGAKEHGRVFEVFLRLYDRVLRRTLRHRWLVVPAMILIIASTVWFKGQLGTGFMPDMDEGAFVLDFVTPPGTSLQESDRLLRQIETILHDTPEIDSYSRRTGSGLGFEIHEPNTGDFAVTLKPSRKRSVFAIMDDLRDKIVSTVPGVEVDFKQVLQDLITDLSGAPAPVEVKLYGENVAQLNALGETIKTKLAKVPGVADSKSSAVETGPELVFRVDPVRAGRAGLTSDAIATQANAALFGDVVTQIVQGDRQIGVRVRYPASARADKSTLALLPIRSPNGYNLPLSALATIDSVPGTSESSRENQRRLVSVSAELAGRDLGNVATDVQKMMQSVKMPVGVTYELGGQFATQADSFHNLLQVLALAILLVFAVMVFQFGGFMPPLVILLVMPLSLFGVTLALWATHTQLNVSSYMGAIMLVGIVVKNGILLLDQAQKAERNGTDVEDAMVHAGEVRLRPILMTTLTAILGLVPLAFGWGAGAEMQKPLAIAVIGGLTFSTVFTLLFVPSLYVSFRKRLNAFPASKPAETQTDIPPPAAQPSKV